MGDKSKFVKGIKVRRSYWSLGVWGSGKVVLRSEEVMAWWIKGKTRNSCVYTQGKLKKTITLCSNVLDYVVKIAWYFVLKKSNIA